MKIETIHTVPSLFRLLMDSTLRDAPGVWSLMLMTDPAWSFGVNFFGRVSHSSFIYKTQYLRIKV